MPQRVTLHEQAWRRHLNAGDPGAYNPYEFEHAGKIPKGKRAAFNSTTEKKFPAKIEGLDSPVVGHYPKVCPKKTIGELDDAGRAEAEDGYLRARLAELERASAVAGRLGPPGRGGLSSTRAE